PQVPAGQVDQAAETLFSMLGPAGMAKLPEVQAALKKYGSWSKVPEAERMKLYPQIMAAAKGGAVGGAFDVLGGSQGIDVFGDDPMLEVPQPKGPDGWVTTTELKYPAFDP